VSSAMELNPDTLDKIGEYVKDHLGTWLQEVSPLQVPGAGGAEELRREFDLRERMVRVEEELKAQREVMQQGFAMMERRFEAVDKRFEAVDRRFEAVDKHFDAVDKRFEEQTAHFNARFEDINRHTTRWMLLISLFLGVIGVMPWVMGAY
jgi:predicted transcriptional regulator